MSLFDWIGSFPELQRKAIVEAVETASLAKVRQALRLLKELTPEQRGRPFTVELLSTYNLEPVLPSLELALSSMPSQAQLQLAPLNDLEGHITRTSAQTRDARVIVWRVEELLPEALYPFSNGFPEQLSSRTEICWPDPSFGQTPRSTYAWDSAICFNDCVARLFFESALCIATLRRFAAEWRTASYDLQHRCRS